MNKETYNLCAKSILSSELITVTFGLASGLQEGHESILSTDEKMMMRVKGKGGDDASYLD